MIQLDVKIQIEYNVQTYVRKKKENIYFLHKRKCSRINCTCIIRANLVI